MLGLMQTFSSRPFYLVSPLNLVDLLFGQGFTIYREQTTRLGSVDNLALCFTQTSSTSEKKFDETMQKSIIHFCAILGLYQVSLWTSKKCTQKCKSLLLQQSCNKYWLFFIHSGVHIIKIN